MGREARSWVIPALVAAVLAGQGIALLEPGQRPNIMGLTILVLDVIGFGAALRAARRGDTALWRMIAIGRLCSLLTSLVLAAAGITGNDVMWWVGLSLRLVSFVFVAAAVLFTPGRRLSARGRLAYLSETITVVAGGFMVVWYFAIDPVIQQSSPGLVWIREVGYPLGDLLMLLAVAVSLLRGAASRAAGPMALLIAGMGIYLAGDVFWSGVQMREQQMLVTSPVAGALLAVGSLLMTLAPMRVRGPEPRPGRDARSELRWSTHLPVTAMVISGTLIAAVTVAEHDLLPWGGLVLGLITMNAAITTRQVISLRESRDQIVTDPLTALANRTGLFEAITRESRQSAGLLLIDLDGFKPINDAYGHAAGDTVLVEFAHLLRSSVRTEDVVARLGGDEFVALLPGVDDAERAGGVAQRILTTLLARPVQLGDDTVPIRASIGLTISTPGETAKDLLRRADLAMYQIKRAGTHGWIAYDPSMADRRAEDAALSDDLSKALARNELQVLFQPIVELPEGLPKATEALVRWNHPVHGTVSPVRFIPLAERSGAIHDIGLFVLERACEQLREWPSLYMSVNLSPRQLQRPTLVLDVLAVLQRTGIEATRLVLEVTESAIVDQSAIDVLTALRSHGIRIAVDDFGTGYSSLQYLTRLPVDVLKIDRSFVARLDGTPEGSAIVEAVLRLSEVLHLATVAEGIETAEQAAELYQLGCTSGQGYLYSRPRTAQELNVNMPALNVMPDR
ncbi:bifunctional diguanylate cyclase/phosphodiesterase [Actinoplanes sp. TFC3]|uniref:putative bifunctional diguanylate cyclase/phosphodiesterase n=1 Tax=Actinoplanes sp. TFC3 TaxID=1710355 RepID=UPI00082D7754|nr:bifunctional diguanylate cyclase/phosphodiesterase [Actinoplanes sp. TFC3]